MTIASETRSCVDVAELWFYGSINGLTSLLLLGSQGSLGLLGGKVGKLRKGDRVVS